MIDFDATFHILGHEVRQVWLILASSISLAFLVLETRRLDWSREGLSDVLFLTGWRGFLGYGLLLVITIALFAEPMRYISSTVVKSTMLFLLWATMSWFWASRKYLSARRIVQWWILSAVALVVASLLSLAELVSLFVACGLAYIVAGLMVCVYNKSLFNSRGRFAGASKPNAIAHYIVIVTLGIIYLDSIGRVSPLFSFPVLAIVLLLLALTRSRTTIYVYLFIGLIWILVNPSVIAISSWIWTLLAVVVLGVLTIYLKPSAPSNSPKRSTRVETVGSFVNMGRSLDQMKHLEGRVALWNYLRPYLLERPIIGHGFGSFWDKSRSCAAADWRPASAHSLYFDLMLNVGFIGLVFFLLILVNAVIAGARLPQADFNLVIVIFATYALWGLVESTLIQPTYEAFTFLVLSFHM